MASIGPELARSTNSRPRRPSETKKRIEDVVAYALRHKTRVHILIVLNEGTFSTGQIAEIIGEPLNHVSNHVRELLEAGSIEIAKTEVRRNANQHFYRAIAVSHFSDEEVAAMTPEERQVTVGLHIQSMLAEVLAGLSSGAMTNDPRLWLSWDWFNVDERGRREIADEQARSWERIREIETEAVNRVADSGESTISVIASQTGFPRARRGPKPSVVRKR